MKVMKEAPCPCGRLRGKRLLSYEACCGPYLGDYERVPAPDPESLMRSRYSAFVLQRADYLLATWDASTRPAQLDFDVDAKWLGLVIRAVNTQEAPDADHAEVEFVARSRVGGRGQRLHERSRFLRRDGRWFYVDGELFS